MHQHSAQLAERGGEAVEGTTELGREDFGWDLWRCLASCWLELHLLGLLDRTIKLTMKVRVFGPKLNRNDVEFQSMTRM